MPLNANSLVRLRDERRWSNAELARRSGLTRPTVSRYADGTTKKIDPESCFALARALGVHPAEIDPIYNDPILCHAKHPSCPLNRTPAWLAELHLRIDQIPANALTVLEAAAKAAVKKYPPQDDEIPA